MDAAGDRTVIDEASIQEAMEDVGLSASDLNLDKGEEDENQEFVPEFDVVEEKVVEEVIGEDAVELEEGKTDADTADASSCIKLDAEDSKDHVDDKEHVEEVMDCSELVISEDKMAVVPKPEEDAGASEKAADEPDVQSEGVQERKEGDVAEDKDKDDENHNKPANPGTPSLRRSSRTSKQPNSPAPANETTPASQGRTTRSQFNPDILAKQKSFMQKYQIAVKSPMDEYVRSAACEGETKTSEGTKRKLDESDSSSNNTSPILEKRLKKSSNAHSTKNSGNGGHFLEVQEESGVKKHDVYCWACHLPDGQIMECCSCPRSFHQRCVQQQSPTHQSTKWSCPECISVRNAAKAARVISIEQMSTMLTYALTRIKSVADAQPFFRPVDSSEFPKYGDYVVYPVDIGQLEEKVVANKYPTTRAFMADFRWILHNCIIFNSFHSKLTNTARTLMKVCKHEMAEIDTCADCYVHAHTQRNTWFLEPCRRPHLLIWAKLKGFPHWPAKAMKANKEGNVDVRFFGAHDRAWVPVKDCYLYSLEMPQQVKNKRKANLDSSIEEVQKHIQKLKDKFGDYQYPAARTAYNPQKEEEQLLQVLPGYKPPVHENAQTSTLSKRSKMNESAAESEMEAEPELVHQSDSDREGTGTDPVPSEPTETDPLRSSPSPATTRSPSPVSTTPVTGQQASSASPVASTVSISAPAEGDRVEDCNFLAMLQLAPRSAVESSTTTALTTSSSSAPTKVVSSADAQQIVANLGTSNVIKLQQSSSAQGKTYKVIRTSKLRVNNGESVAEAVCRTESSTVSSSTEKAVKQSVSAGDKSSGRSSMTRINSKNQSISRRDQDPLDEKSSKDSIVIKTEPPDENGPFTPAVKNSGSRTSGNASNVALSIDAVVGNYKEGVTPIPSAKSTPKSSSKSNSGRSGSKVSSAKKAVVAEAEEDLDPSMYLDPTITITLVNNSGSERKNASKAIMEDSGPGSISSSDLQALNALGENVSITVVPKRKTVPSTGASGGVGGVNIRSKENEAVEQSMVIEIDPASVQKNSRAAPQAKARKSFPRSRSTSTQQQQIQQQKNAAKGSAHVPPMVSIPSRHLGSMDVGTRPLSVHQPPQTNARVPSITVRPVTQLAQPQPSIILQTGSTTGAAEIAPITAIAAIKPQPAAVSQAQVASSASSATTSSNTLTLNAMHALGPDSAFGTGGLLLTFNRSLPTFATSATAPTTAVPTAAATPTPVLSTTNSKIDGSVAGPISAQLAAKTQQISDMVRQTLESLMEEVSSAGSLEATVLQLRLDLERSRLAHQQEVAELKRTLEVQQAGAESEKQRALNDLRRQLEADKKRAIEEAKKKQWCAQCGQEAIYYCCWNTAYCDHPCQQLHWQKHMATCANANQNTNESVASDDASVGDAPTRALSPQKPAQGAVNGSSPQSKKSASAPSKGVAKADCYAIVAASDVSALATPGANSATPASRSPSSGGGTAQVTTISTGAPITLLVTTPTRSAPSGSTVAASGSPVGLT